VVCSRTAAPSFIEQQLYRYQFLHSLFACHIYPRETARTFCILSQTFAWNSVEKIFIVREETEKILLSMTSNDPYSARLLRSIAFLTGVLKDMTFRKIISSDDVDSFIGCEDKKTSLCFFITPDDEIYIKRDSSLRVSPVTIILCNLKVVTRRDASIKFDFYVPYTFHFRLPLLQKLGANVDGEC